ncbi:sulfotransferase family protein [Parahaliea mediterranea]|uniref:Sulfotransferase n=1 Tax=Parahaliea mediterranea TaxID=651086 RepID=A0A939DGH0_9GAMM|nr:sulfotransferase [Parahaliea mediterranea]MBN7797779.1 sulfotransferase [Parahaliea mediterranea]
MNKSDMQYLPLVIIGAPRSGTNMLRDILCRMDGVATWPCDEINYIWRHGNLRHPSDEFPADLATSFVRGYIRSKFDWVARTRSAGVVVEKTCANSLRVPFVDRVLPEAKYIYIYRDGIDATGSARLRWTAEMDVPYLLQKLRFVPPTDIPYYGVRYLGSRIHRVFSKENRLAFWGPATKDMDELVSQFSLNEICALQWQRCNELAERAFEGIREDRVVRLRYEDIVTDPARQLTRILNFLGMVAEPEVVAKAVSDVSASSLGKGRSAFSSDEVAHLENLVGGTLSKLGYLNN